MITFVIFIWFTLKFVWPPIMKAMDERQNKIAAGLSAAEQGQQALKTAQEEVARQLKAAKDEAAKIVDQAHQRAIHIVDESKVKAQQEGERLLQLAQDEIKREYSQAKANLTKQITSIAVMGAEKILGREVDRASNDRLVDDLVGEL